MSSAEIPYWWDHGLLETSESDQLCYDECFARQIPFTAHWANLDDTMKSFAWDTEWEKFIRHCGEVIDYEGREKWLPWKIYAEQGLQWLDGYNFVQRTGDCYSFAHRNATKTCNLTNAKRLDKKPIEFAHSVVYALARGNGKVSFGSGCNLNPGAKWAAAKGNYWTSDFGRYDAGKYVSQYKPGSVQDTNALKTQTIPLFLPEPNFDYCYAVCSAGFGIVIGSTVYPTSAVPNDDGLSVPTGWKHSDHATALIAAFKGKSGKRYIYLENSHGDKYAGDSLHTNKQHGCWLTEADFKRMIVNAYRFGVWYAALTEMTA
jgi:hypothetical protein